MLDAGGPYDLDQLSPRLRIGLHVAAQESLNMLAPKAGLAGKHVVGRLHGCGSPRTRFERTQ